MWPRHAWHEGTAAPCGGEGGARHPTKCRALRGERQGLACRLLLPIRRPVVTRRQMLTDGRPGPYTSGARSMPDRHLHMVTVAQLAERQIVALKVAGSRPVGHPISALDSPWSPGLLLCQALTMPSPPTSRGAATRRCKAAPKLLYWPRRAAAVPRCPCLLVDSLLTASHVGA